jgi:hypothetical protein
MTCLMIMKYTIDKSIRQSITCTDSVKAFLFFFGCWWGISSLISTK